MTTMKDFKVGDRVRVVKAQKPTYWYAHRIGEVFTIDEIVDDYMTYEWKCYRIKENKARLLQQPDIELVEDTEKESGVNKFNVGDKVKYVGKDWTEWGNDEMKVEEIVCGNYHCLNPEHGLGSFYEEDLTLCNQESKVLTLEEQKVQLQKQLAEIEQQIEERNKTKYDSITSFVLTERELVALYLASGAMSGSHMKQEASSRWLERIITDKWVNDRGSYKLWERMDRYVKTLKE